MFWGGRPLYAAEWSGSCPGRDSRSAAGYHLTRRHSCYRSPAAATAAAVGQTAVAAAAAVSAAGRRGAVDLCEQPAWKIYGFENFAWRRP